MVSAGLYSKMTMLHLLREQFPSWQEYYWTYQYKLAELHYIPLIESWGVSLQGKRVLDVGCGDGGFTAAMADAGAKCTGVEVRDFSWDQSRPDLRFLVQDILAPEALENLGNDYDLVVLRDVIEHIPLHGKAKFLNALKHFVKPHSKLLITFPPFYSPFGLHQQTLLKSFFRKIPFLGWIPALPLSLLLKLAGETASARADIREIRTCRMTLKRFRKLCAALDLKIEHERYYQIRPSHELRYGWKTRESKVSALPLVREALVLGSVFQLVESDKSLS